MKKIFVLFVSFLCCGYLTAYAQMSDSQVANYVTRALASGKSKTEIEQTLVSRGVTPQQIEKISANLGSSLPSTAAGASTISESAYDTRLKSAQALSHEEFRYPLIDSLYFSAQKDSEKKSPIFGHDLFSGKVLSFEPNETAATPENYILGPGDEIAIEIWGYNEASISQKITPEGRISISQIGPVQLSGLTIKEAETKIKKLLATKYSSLGSDASNASVTLAGIRSIQVHILGELKTPGTYRLSSFSTVFNALHRAGGLVDRGSLREIKLIRAGKEFKTIDIYGYLFEGKSDSDVRLQDGDIIIVPPYSNLVTVSGELKRPMQYELIQGESLGKLIEYAGGFSSKAYTKNLTVIRNSNEEYEIFTVAEDNFDSFAMADGDSLFVEEIPNRFANLVQISGRILHPGLYQLGDDVTTVKQFILKAGGPLEDALLSRARIVREKEDLSHELISFNLGAILSGEAEDIVLKKNDYIYISNKIDIRPIGELIIQGMVRNPGPIDYIDNVTIEDLILRAGGLLDGASYARVDVSRRNIDPKSLVPADTLSLVYTCPIKDGFVIEDDEPFILQPYDVVSVRTTPGFGMNFTVTLEGEMVFPGEYVMMNRGERVSQIIQRAGGLTSYAYPKGVRIIRQSTSDFSKGFFKLDDKKDSLITKENLSKSSSSATATNRTDSLNITFDDVYDSYLVSINLEKALANPGSEYDLVLRKGDRIIVPEYDNTVRVIGEVMSPNAVSYVKSQSLKKYIRSAGGYTQNAKKNKVYVVYPNGSATTMRLGNAKIEPGCLIIVPSKIERKSISIGEIAAISNAASSITTMVALLTRFFI